MGAMSNLVNALKGADVINDQNIQEMSKWTVIQIPPASSEPTVLSAALQLIEEALQEYRVAIIRETDLDALKEFTATIHSTKLYWPDWDGSANETDIYIGKNRCGDYLIPCLGFGDDSEQLVGQSGDVLVGASIKEGSKTIYFDRVRTLFYGSTATFFVCTPRKDAPSEDASSEEAKTHDNNQVATIKS